jgi:hypothetical protein
MFVRNVYIFVQDYVLLLPERLQYEMYPSFRLLSAPVNRLTVVFRFQGTSSIYILHLTFSFLRFLSI